MNIFYDLHIYGKETITSNFFAWILNPKGSHDFGNKFLVKFLEVLSIDIEYDSVHIKREYLGKINKKNNYIDIVIELKKNEKLKGAIGIENKVFSREGLKQTERYWEILNKNYPDIPIIPIYLTLENMPVSLSNNLFKHIKYSDLKDVFNSFKGKLDIVDSFIEAYIERKEEQNELSLLREDSISNLVKENDWNTINSKVCRIISFKINEDRNNMVAFYNYSAKSGKAFFLITSINWDLEVENLLFNIHLEGDIGKLVIHFEVKPYRSINKLNEYEKDIFQNEREKYREKFKNFIISSSVFEVKNINSNDTLTVYKLKTLDTSFDNYLIEITNLFQQVEKFLSSHNTTISDIPFGDEQK